VIDDLVELARVLVVGTAPFIPEKDVMFVDLGIVRPRVAVGALIPVVVADVPDESDSVLMARASEILVYSCVSRGSRSKGAYLQN
jgi:hypothetical protein